MKTTKATNKTHGLFWSLISQLDGYTESHKQDIKEAIVTSFSEEKTASLSEMYTKFPREYAEMIDSLKETIRKGVNAKLKKDAEGDKWRKRCIAAVCKWLELRNLSFETKEQKIGYAISVICRAASCSDFNSITIERLTDIYSEFGRKQKVVRESLKITDFGVGLN